MNKFAVQNIRKVFKDLSRYIKIDSDENSSYAIKEIETKEDIGDNRVMYKVTFHNYEGVPEEGWNDYEVHFNRVNLLDNNDVIWQRKLELDGLHILKGTRDEIYIELYFEFDAGEDV